jgi:TonB-linked SusC/RagA family outer membrane protein
MRKLALILSLIMCIGLEAVFAQTKTITGIVTSTDDGGPIPGASIVVKGTTIGTISKFDGTYELPVPVDATVLTVSFVGMKTQEVQIQGRTKIDFKLESDAIGIDEIVVTGYGVQKKREVTGAIAQVKGDVLANLPTPSFESQLSGRMAGVQITTTTGVLGQVPNISIRGVNSITSGTYPLVVVDGVPILTGNYGAYAAMPHNAMADINPADIASIEVLKDGSATAIYGSRAANGVILITTKKGATGKAKVVYSNYFALASPVKVYDLLNAKQFIEINNEKIFNSNPATPAQAIAQLDANGKMIDTDWMSLVLNDRAKQSEHNLSISGANEKTNYYLSVGYTSQEGVAVANTLERYSFKTNLEQKIYDWVKVGTSASMTHTIIDGLNQGSNSLSGNVFNAIRALPNVSPWDVNDPTGFNIDDQDTRVLGRGANLRLIDDNLPNIMFVLENNRARSKSYRALGNIYLEATFLKKFVYRPQISADMLLNDGYQYWDPRHGDGAGRGGYVMQQFQNATRWNLQNVLTYTDKFADAHNLSVTLVQEAQKQKYYWFDATGQNISDRFFRHNIITGTAGTQTIAGSMSENALYSLAARLNYNYKNKYLLQGSIRQDGLSSLPTDNRYGIFPGGSIGWTLSEENFIKDNFSIISDLKLRTSYASVGNTSIGNYPYLGLYGSAQYGTQNGVAFSQMGNGELKWETSNKFNVGLDLSLWAGRFGFHVDYYKNDQSNLILAAPTPPSLGVPSNQINKNVGSLYNKGFEISANYAIISSQDLKWDIDAVLTLNENKVVELNEGQDLVYTYSIVREGESMYSLYGYEYHGVNKANGNPIWVNRDGLLVQGNIPNQTYYLYDKNNPTQMDASNQTVFNIDDKKVLGNSVPTYYGSVTNNVKYKNFDLSVMFRFSGGNKVFNRTRSELLSQSFHNNGTEVLGRWQSPENPGDGVTPRLYIGRSNFTNLNENTVSRFVEDANFVKLDNIRLGYSLPKAISQRVNIESIRIFAQAQNVVTFSSYKGLDPEMAGGSGFSGVDYNSSPIQRVLSMGINVNF